MKKARILLFACVCLACNAESNLLQNGDFNGKDFMADLTLQQHQGKVQMTKVTEDLSWNQCLKMEIVAFKETDGRKQLNAVLHFGKNGKNCGIEVKPNKFYKFSLELKGTRDASFWIVMNDEPTEHAWKGQSVRPTPQGASAVPDAWTHVNGRFKTGPNTKFAHLGVQLWADSSQQRNIPSIGDYIMVDNVNIEEVKSLDGGNVSTKDFVSRIALRPAVVTPVQTVLTLQPRELPGNDLALPVEISCDDDGIAFTAELPPAKQGLKPVTENGGKLWREDVVELFFAPPVKDRLYTQFAMSSGGGRYRGTGSEDGQYDRWEGKVWSEEDRRFCSMNIPWEQIGYASKPPAGTCLGINIGIFLDKKNYAYAPVKTGFGDVDNFANIIFGTVEQYRDKTARELAENLPEELRKEFQTFASTQEKEPGKVIAAAQTLLEKVKSTRLGVAPFLVARLPITWNFSYPVSFDLEQLIQGEINLTSAGNEIVMLPLAIQNRTERTAAYRIIIHADAKNFHSAELTGLGSGFPQERIIFREAFPVKDSDKEGAGLIFDPLPKMNEAHVIMVPAHETGIVWLEFDCDGIHAGRYPGSIRVIPLSEPATFTSNNYKGKMRDYPLVLEVLPFQLPPPRSINMFNAGVSRDYFVESIKLGSPKLSVSTWFFSFKFDDKGNLLDGNATRAVTAFEKAKALFADAPAWVKPSFHIGYSMYKVFMQICLPKNIKVFSPEWENCWRNYLKAFWQVVQDCGIPPEQLEIELVDEPEGKYEEEYLAMTRIAAETLPDAKFMMTWGPANFGFNAEKIARFEPYLKGHEYHQFLLNYPDMVEQIGRMQKQNGVFTAMYECSTNIRESLHTYFRLHPWRVRFNRFDEPGFYTFVQNSWGQPGAQDWKVTSRGAITYRSDDHCIPSIRMFALQQGVTDVRYWDALEANRDNPEVEAFLKVYPEKVLRERHDSTLPDKFKQEAIKLLLKVETME
ncbi:MAG: hypothetical protein J6X55_08120 [Victivallales bacterium]|nr:hypothetical protein [Victivallales bacterium]